MDVLEVDTVGESVEDHADDEYSSEYGSETGSVDAWWVVHGS
jgi:hypothetical protein